MRRSLIAFAALGCVVELGLACAVQAQTGAAAAAGASASAGASATVGASSLPSAPAGSIAMAAGQTATGQASTGASSRALPPGPPDPRRVLPARVGALTMDQVVDAVLAKNPTLISAERNLAATKAQEIQAGVRQDFQFQMNGQYVTLAANNPASPYTYYAQLSRTFERGQKRKWRIEGAQATTAQTAAQLQDQQRGMVLTAEQAFTNMLLAKASLALANANLADFRHEVDVNHSRFIAGDIGKLDFERLDLQLSQYESDQANALINLRQASDQLQTLMGVDKPSEDFDILGDIVPPDIHLDMQSVDDKALAARPDYKAAVFGVDVAQAGKKLAYANGTIDPTLEGEWDRVAAYNSPGFYVTIPIRIFDRNQGNKKTADFQVESSQFAEVAAKNQVLSDVDQAWVGYDQSRLLSDRFSQHYVDESTDVLRTSQFAYDHGGIALIDYLDALRDSRQTASDALNAYANTWLALEQLRYASATKLYP